MIRSFEFGWCIVRNKCILRRKVNYMCRLALMNSFEQHKINEVNKMYNFNAIANKWMRFQFALSTMCWNWFSTNEKWNWVVETYTCRQNIFLKKTNCNISWLPISNFWNKKTTTINCNSRAVWKESEKLLSLNIIIVQSIRTTNNVASIGRLNLNEF